MDREEFAKVVEQWYDPLYRFALSMCGRSEDALDLTQNAFRKLASKGEDLRDLSKAKSWLFSVAHREYIDEYRHAKRFPTTSLESSPPIKDRSSPAPQGQSIDATAALQALSELDERFRAPISLFYLQDFSYKEISEMLDIPIGTVMSRLRRAKDHLRRLLEQPAKQTSKTVQFPREA